MEFHRIGLDAKMNKKNSIVDYFVQTLVINNNSLPINEDIGAWISKNCLL